MTSLPLWFPRDRLAAVALCFLFLVGVSAIMGPWLLQDAAKVINLRARNLAPFQLEHGWLYILGSDSIGRSMLARLLVGAGATMGIAVGVVIASMIVGAGAGIVAGMSQGMLAATIMRAIDVVMSFPSLLLALIVLYILGGDPLNIILVLAVARLPIYVRTARARTLELRERPFIAASSVMGGGAWHIAWHHVMPSVMPTLIIIGSLDFAYVMLAESSLSFLGLGVQPPNVTWGLMVSEGRSYLNSAWWLSFWPGLSIMLTALATNLVAIWLRTQSNPGSRFTMERPDA